MVSCGKNNSVGTNASTGFSALSTAGTDTYGRVPLQTYIAQINNNGFGAAVADSEIYRFYKTSSSGNGCTLHSWYYICSSSSSGASGTYTTANVVHSTESLAAKKTELINLIASARNYSNSTDKTQLYIQTTQGYVYTIDFRVPMSANPVVKYDNTGTTLFDYSFSGYSQFTTY